jgi:hypothetical protein
LTSFGRGLLAVFGELQAIKTRLIRVLKKTILFMVQGMGSCINGLDMGYGI